MKNKKNILILLSVFGFFLFFYEVNAQEARPGNMDCLTEDQLGESCLNGLGQVGTCKLGPDGIQVICIANGPSATSPTSTDSDWQSISQEVITGGGGATGCDPGFTKMAGVCFPDSTGLPDPQGGVLEILANLLAWLFALFTILAIGSFVISGIQYLVSAGDTGVIEIAKRNMKWSFVGIIVGLSGFLILTAVMKMLSGNPIF